VKRFTIKAAFIAVLVAGFAWGLGSDSEVIVGRFFNSVNGYAVNGVTVINSAGTVVAATSGNAATATALASNPTDCAADTYATTIAASGNLTCAAITNASTTATSANTASAIVARDSNGDFIAGKVNAQVLSIAPAAEAITAAATITANACGGLKLLSSAGDVTTNTTDTFTAPATANKGCYMSVCNTAAHTITLDNNAHFTSAAGADVALAQNECISVISDGSATWYQVSAKLSDHS
jgi:hypothetical protein